MQEIQNEIHFPVTLIKNENITGDYYLASFEYNGKAPLAGQFVNIEAKPFFLKRPFTVFDYKDNILKVLYRIVGKGTKAISMWQEGYQTNMLAPLGKGYPIHSDIKKNVLIGGGTGIASLFYFANSLKEKPLVLLGFNNQEEAEAFEKLFSKTKADIKVSSLDGKKGYHGNVIEMANELLKDEKDYNIYACGPHVMLDALNKSISLNKIADPLNTYVSLEARMGCGFGVCLGCAVEKKNSEDFYYVCKDGPVFKLEELAF